MAASAGFQTPRDQMVSEAGLRELMRRGDDAPGDLTALDMEAIEIERTGLSEFRVTSDDPKVSGGALIFARSRLGWKLAGVRIPEAARGRSF